MACRVTSQHHNRLRRLGMGLIRRRMVPPCSCSLGQLSGHRVNKLQHRQLELFALGRYLGLELTGLLGLYLHPETVLGQLMQFQLNDKAMSSMALCAPLCDASSSQLESDEESAAGPSQKREGEGNRPRARRECCFNDCWRPRFCCANIWVCRDQTTSEHTTNRLFRRNYSLKF